MRNRLSSPCLMCNFTISKANIGHPSQSKMAENIAMYCYRRYYGSYTTMHHNFVRGHLLISCMTYSSNHSIFKLFFQSAVIFLSNGNSFVFIRSNVHWHKRKIGLSSGFFLGCWFPSTMCRIPGAISRPTGSELLLYPTWFPCSLLGCDNKTKEVLFSSPQWFDYCHAL